MIMLRQVPQLQTVAKTVEARKLQFIGNFVGRPCDHAAIGLSASNCCEDSGSPIDAAHRQFCGRPCDLAATGPSDSNCDEDGGSLPHAVPLCSLEDLQRMMREG